MKRLLLVFLLAGALLGLLAAPALAGPPSATGFRLAEQTAYIWAYLDGSWFEVTDVDAGTFAIHWVTYDDDGNFVAPADPIPANYDVAMQVSWKGINYGLVKTLPLAFQIKLSIPEAGVDLSYEQAQAYWTGAFLWDDYWVNALGEIPAFNEHLGAQVYANRWLPLLTGDHGLAADYLTAEGKLLPGTYTVSYTENWLRTYTGLEESWVQVGEDEWLRLKTPYHVRPAGEWANDPYTFTVE